MATEYTFLVPLTWEERRQRLAFARRYGLGVEVSALIGGEALNNAGVRAEREAALEKLLNNFSGMKTMHGAFLDLAIHSRDEAIAAISRSRIEADIVTAQRLGCEKIVFHLGFNPLIPPSNYQDELLHAHSLFWNVIAEKYPGILICLENQWEPDWSIFGELFQRVSHPRVGMCFDAAHAQVYGHFGPVTWIQNLAPHIFHMHWNDNHGDMDSHLPLGSGTIEWEKIHLACLKWNSVSITLEINAQPALETSLRFLDQRGWLPHPLSIPPTPAAELAAP